MNPRSHPRAPFLAPGMPARGPRKAWARGRRGLLPVGLMVGALMAWVVPAAAQVPDSLSQAELDYRAAVSTYEAAVDAREAVRERSSSLLAELEQARRSGGASAYESAQQRYWSFIPEMERIDRRVADTRERAQAARQALLRALDVRRERLERTLQAAAPAEHNRLQFQIRDLENQYREVERDENIFEAVFAFSPVEYDPRDGPAELRLKANLLERRAQEIDTQIAEMSREIERLEGRLRLERQWADFEAPLDRFDVDRVPVGGPSRDRTPQGDRVAPDSATLPLSELPLPRRIERMKEIRIQLQSQRELFMDRAESFRARVRGTAS